MRSRIIIGSAAMLLILGIVRISRYFVQEPPISEEQQLALLVAQAQKAAETRHSRSLTRLISQDYYDPYGTTRQQLVGYIVEWMRSGIDVAIAPIIKSLIVRLPYADMTLEVHVWRLGAEETEGEKYLLKVRWRKEGRYWRVISAEGWAEAQMDGAAGD